MKKKFYCLLILSLVVSPVPQIHSGLGLVDSFRKHITNNSRKYKIGAAVLAAGCGIWLLKSKFDSSSPNNEPLGHYNDASINHVASAIGPKESAESLFSYSPIPGSRGLYLQLNQVRFWNKEKKETFRKILLSSPSELLKRNQEIKKLVMGQGSGFITPEWFKNESLAHPLCLLAECSSSYCPLTRSNSAKRSDLEKIILERTKHDFEDFNKETDVLEYTSFACGALFPDLVILTKLIQQGFKHININLIDKTYAEYIKILKQGNGHVSSDIFDSEREDRGYWLRFNSYILTQFLEWFATEADVTVNIYGCVTDYLEECIKDPRRKSDIITGIDYIEEDHLNPAIDFVMLLLCGLKDHRYGFSLIGRLYSDVTAMQSYKRIAMLSKSDWIDVLSKVQAEDPNFEKYSTKIQALMLSKFEIKRHI